MENLLVSDIAKILEEKNFNIAAEELEKVTNLDCFGTENFLHDIILERWVYRPEDIPFSFARDIWKMSDTDVKSDRDLLKEIPDILLTPLSSLQVLATILINFSNSSLGESYNFIPSKQLPLL